MYEIDKKEVEENNGGERGDGQREANKSLRDRNNADREKTKGMKDKLRKEMKDMGGEKEEK